MRESSRLGRRLFLAGGAALLLSGVGLVLNPAEFFRAYLVAFVFWLGLPLGCLALLMIYFIVGGGWGAVLRRILEAAVRTLPWMYLLSLPLALGLAWLYPWARPAEVALSPLLQAKSAYLNVPFVLVRAALYFAVWLALGYLLTRWSTKHDYDGDPRLWARLRTLSGGGLLLFGLTVTFAAIDWLMSLEPEWYSTIYSAMIAMGGVLSAMAFAILVLALLAHRPHIAAVVSPRLFNDLGALLLAFVMLWAYLAYSQFLLIWAAHLAEEIPWYLRRLNGGWEWVAILVTIGEFGLPFALMLSQNLKRNLRALQFVSALLLLARLADVFWLVEPALVPAGLSLDWLDLLLPAAIGCIWVALFRRELAARPLLAEHDPRLAALETHERKGRVVPASLAK